MTSTPTPIRINGRVVEPGTELSVRGWRGRYRYQYARLVEAGAVVEITAYGGPDGHGTYRSCRPDRVRTVHRIPKTRP